MKKWLIILVLMPITWYFTDVRADSGFQSIFLPLFFSAMSLMIFIKLLLLLGVGKSSGSGTTGIVGDSYSGSSNNDCGGGDGGG